MRQPETSRHYPDSGPELRYTTAQVHDLEKAVSHFHRIYNNDIYDLIKWGAEQRARAEAAEAEVARLREGYQRMREALMNAPPFSAPSTRENSR